MNHNKNQIQEVLRNNHTTIYEFILLGFQDLPHLRIPLFSLITIMFLAVVAGNGLIIALVATTRRLHSPMYIFLCHLSLCDIIISTNVAPNTLKVILLVVSPILLDDCLTQFYFFTTTAIMECFLLSAMSYDRYLAICRPLHYTSIMDLRLPHYLALVSWMVGFVQSLIIYTFLLKLQFCGPNVIDHFFCDLAPVLELSCSDTTMVQIEVSFFVIVVFCLQFPFIIITYICIFISILRISSSTGRMKAFSTCSSHLAVVCTYYGTMVTLYAAPTRGYSSNLNKVLSLLNTMVTPLFNPIIYALKNNEIKAVFKSVLFRKRILETRVR